MFSRRFLRIKAMQSVYGHLQDAFESVEKTEKALLDALNNSYQLYVYNLYILTEIVKYVEDEQERLKTNYLEHEDDVLISDKLLNSSIIQYFIEEAQLEAIFKKEKMKEIVDDKGIVDAYHQLKKSEQWKVFISNEDSTEDDAFDVLKFLYYDIVLQHEFLEQHLEEEYISWQDDREFVASCVVKTMKSISKGKSSMLVPFQGNWKEDASFIKELIKGSIYDYEEVDEMIKPYIKNWEIERITMIDRLLIHMAICEFMNIDSVPSRVSLDEYLELAKLYSTPKSKTFINGVLDRVLKDLVKAGKAKA